MDKILKHYSELPLFEALIKALNSHKPYQISLPEGDFTAFVLGLIRHMTNRPLVVVSHNLFQAEILYQKLSSLIEPVGFYPQDEFITLDQIALSDTLKIERIYTLSQIINADLKTVITHPVALLQYRMNPEDFNQFIKPLKKGDVLSQENLLRYLALTGYKSVHAVSKVGEFSHRGSIIDIHQIQYEHPVRIDFFDDEIDSIRVFNAQTQRSIKTLQQITLIPFKELIWSTDEMDKIQKEVAAKARSLNLSPTAFTEVMQDVDQLYLNEDTDTFGRYIPYLDETPSTLVDYFEDPVVIYLNKSACDRSVQTMLNDMIQSLAGKPGFKALHLKGFKENINNQALYLSAFDEFKDLPTLTLRAKESMNYLQNMNMFFKDVLKYQDYQTVVIYSAEKKTLDQFEDVLEDKGGLPIRISTTDIPVENRINLVQTNVPLAFEWLDAKLVWLDDAHILKPTKKRKAKYQSVFKETRPVDSAKSLQRGDYIVHFDHGIGRFLGIQTMKLKELENEYMVIAYQGDDKLYIPVENVYAIQKYDVYEGLIPKLSKLGSSEWQKTKQRAVKKAKEIAINLLRQYALRKSTPGFAYSPDTELMAHIEADFFYEETPDQADAIEAMKLDMESPYPMDRLICGDVGYGKTEIALRGAFKAVLDSKQVAYLAPTTILTRQHYQTFYDRLNKHGINVRLLNRFTSAKETKEILEQLKKGTVDILIGTHRILSDDVVFKDLGFLVIDEEQRFGVRHKEKIQSMRNSIDVLTLTATPIPRTLQLGLSGIKSMSILNTPPKNRHPIQTYVLKRSQTVIKDAIERELGRDGQVFYLYNRVEMIERVAAEIHQLVPSARVVYAHGQMNKQTLERIIQDFVDQKYDILVSTTIIETGLDIPNANTLIVHEADRLGLSQLYQIRGRVGRSDRIAYSYMMVEPHKILSEEASKRLNVIKDFTALGSGYKIAARDLAIRGAGDVLGAEQSGFIQSVGIDMFMQMIQDEIKAIEHPEAAVPIAAKEAKMNVSKAIPDDYIADEDEKFNVHKEIIALTSSIEVIQLKESLEDRFGKLPSTVYDYMCSKVYEHLAAIHQVERFRKNPLETTITLSEKVSSQAQGDKLFERANEISPKIKLAYRQKKITLTISHLEIQRPLSEIGMMLLESL